MTRNFKRSEFACKCGCGVNHIQAELVDKLQLIRDEVGKPVHINSGVRCGPHNKAVGGKPSSYHLLGKAADIRVAGMSTEALYAIARRIPGLKGFGLYNGFLHVDTRRNRAIWDERTKH